MRRSEDRLFTFRLVPLLAGVLARKGIDASELLRDTGLPAEAMHGEFTAPLARIKAFVTLVAERLERPLFGLELAELVGSGAYGLLEFMARSAPTVGRSFEAVCEFGALINPIADFHLLPGPDDTTELHYIVVGQRDTLGMVLNEYTLAFLVRALGLILGEPLPVARVWFSHSRPGGGDAVAQWFRANAAFERPDCGFAVAPATLARVPRTADPALFDFLVKQARAQLAYVGKHDIVSQVVRVIEVRMAHGDVGTAAVANAMASTPRSLQRHLLEAGTTYRDVLAHVRSRHRTQLARAGLTEPEIAHRLGFADARSMRRSLDEAPDSMPDAERDADRAREVAE